MRRFRFTEEEFTHFSFFFEMNLLSCLRASWALCKGRESVWYLEIGQRNSTYLWWDDYILLFDFGQCKPVSGHVGHLTLHSTKKVEKGCARGIEVT